MGVKLPSSNEELGLMSRRKDDFGAGICFGPGNPSNNPCPGFDTHHPAPEFLCRQLRCCWISGQCHQKPGLETRAPKPPAWTASDQQEQFVDPTTGLSMRIDRATTGPVGAAPHNENYVVDGGRNGANTAPDAPQLTAPQTPSAPGAPEGHAAGGQQHHE